MPKQIAAQWINTEDIDRQLSGKADLEWGKLKESQIPDKVVLDDELLGAIQNLQNSIYPLVNDLESGGTNKALSAEQGKVLKLYYDQIKSILKVNDETKDTLQEIVDFIKMNKATLDTLGIWNIAGLTEALYNKANRVHTHIIDVNVSTARNDKNKIGTTAAGWYVPQKWDQLLVNFVNGNAIPNSTLNIDGSSAKGIYIWNHSADLSVFNLGNVANSNIKIMMWFDGVNYQIYWSWWNSSYAEIPENEISDPTKPHQRSISGRRIAKIKEYFEKNTTDPTQPTHSANKKYVDSKIPNMGLYYNKTEIDTKLNNVLTKENIRQNMWFKMKMLQWTFNNTSSVEIQDPDVKDISFLVRSFHQDLTAYIEVLFENGKVVVNASAPQTGTIYILAIIPQF